MKYSSSIKRGIAMLAVLITPLLCQGQAIITTVAGVGSFGYSGDGGPATSATFGITAGVAVDKSGNIYIADSVFDVVRKVSPSGVISLYAGGGSPASLGDGGPATGANLSFSASTHIGLAVDSAGNLYIADYGNMRIRKVNTLGIVTTVAGNSPASGKGGFAGDGGPATSALLDSPTGVAIDSAGNLYIADYGNLRIRKVNASSGTITTIAGIGNSGGSDAGDGGPATAAQLSRISDVAVDGSGNVYIADQEHIRQVNAAGLIHTVVQGFLGTCSQIPEPASYADVAANGLAVDSAGNLYIADKTADCVQELATNGTVTTVAGGGANTNGDGGPATSAVLVSPFAVAVDGAGNLYIAAGDAIRKVTARANLPVISTNGVVNGASFLPGLVSNAWATIQGSNLSAVTDNWNHSIVNGNLPTSLDGVRVTIGSVPAYVDYVSPSQINLLVPPNLPPGPAQVTVTNAAGTSASTTVTVNSYQPAFFPWPNNQVVATRMDYSWAAQAGTFAGAGTVPAKPGDLIILWGTGFGPTNPTAPTGIPVPSSTTYLTSTLPTVTIDNLPAIVDYAALTPGSAGLYQVAIQLPGSLANGTWPIVATIGGVQSPAGVVLAVQH